MDLCGEVFRHIAPLMGQSVRMALEGTSAPIGAPPYWLRRASDVRVLAFDELHGSTLLELEAPRLGDAATEIYNQKELWQTIPSADDTALDVFARVTQEIRDSNQESGLFDRQLLKRFSHLHQLFTNKLQAVRIPVVRGSNTEPVEMNQQIIVNAAQLSQRTPPPSQVRLAGKLDMIRHSTRTFGLLTDQNIEVRGVLDSQDMTESLKAFLGKRVLVLGKAIYRPSGSLLRIDASAVQLGEGQPSLFSKIPIARSARPALMRSKVSDNAKKGVAAFLGTWPGDESDEELAAMVMELRK
jgi:hypothetical protein